MAEVLSEFTGEMRQSICRVEISVSARAASPDDWTVTFEFEDGLYDKDGKLVGKTQPGSRSVSRRFGDIKDSAVAGYKISDVADIVRKIGYALREEDVAAEATRKMIP